MVDYNLRSLCYNVDCHWDNRFVWIDFQNNTKKIYFPLWYRIPDNDYECRLSILNLIKTLKRNDYYWYNFWNNSWDFYELPLNSYLWIINDYLTNGLYYDIEKEYAQKQSWKINRRRTLKTKPYISNWNIIFLNPFVEKKTSESNIITIIHSFCVRKSVEEIWWLFWNIKVPFSSFSEKNKEFYIKTLNQELTRSFDDRKKWLITHMKRIIEESSNKENTIANKIYWTDKYEWNWEFMVNEIFWNMNPEDFFPWTSRHIHDRIFNNSKLRPDTILSIDDSLYIIDSKYYRYWITWNPLHLPQSDSIQKQITYWDFILNNKEYKNIFNAFVLPYNKEDNPFGINWNIEYLWFAKSDWRPENPNQYEHIALILIDTKYLIDCYLWNEEKEMTTLVESIENILNTYDN